MDLTREASRASLELKRSCGVLSEDKASKWCSCTEREVVVEASDDVESVRV